MAKLTLINGDESESIIKNTILTYLWYNRVFCWNNSSTGIHDPSRGVFRRANSKFQFKGVSDIIGIFRGRPLFIEVKSKTGRLSEDQKTFLERVGQEGAIAFVARSVEDVERVLFP